jgi:hypothetical protein
MIMAMRIRPLLLSLVLLLLAPAVMAQDARTEFGLTRARLLEAVLLRMFPTASKVEWGSTLVLVEGTNRREVRVADVDYRPDDGGGYTGVLTVEFPADHQAIHDAIGAFEPPPSRSLAEVVAFKTSAAFAISELRRGSLGDPTSMIEEVDDVELTTLTYDQPWPDVYVTYRGLYATTDFAGQVTWDAKLVVTPAVAIEGRIPSSLWRAEKSGARHGDTANVEAENENTLAFVSVASKQIVTRCTDPCQPDGRVLLALWWTSAKTVAITP